MRVDIFFKRAREFGWTRHGRQVEKYYCMTQLRIVRGMSGMFSFLLSFCFVFVFFVGGGSRAHRGHAKTSWWIVTDFVSRDIRDLKWRNVNNFLVYVACLTCSCVLLFNQNMFCFSVTVQKHSSTNVCPRYTTTASDNICQRHGWPEYSPSTAFDPKLLQRHVPI